MAQQVFGPSAVVSVLNRAFTNTSPSNAVFNNQVATAGVTDASQLAFARSFGATYAVGQTSAQLSATVMMNLGLDNAALATALTDYINANGKANIGIIAYQLSSILSGLENDVTYGAAAKAWNAEVTSAYEYSSNVKNTNPSTGATTGNEAGTSTVLTTAQDIVTGSAGADFFRGVAGAAVGAQEQTTFNSSDIIDGGAGQDALILNLVGNYGGGARVKGIETLQLGTNVLVPVAFDYNVNAGQNEITDVTKIVYDQINVGESLTVNNIIKTVDVLPTLAWVNDSVSRDAGVTNANYRGSQVVGTGNTLTTGTPAATAGDTQAVQLQSVEKGVLNIASGIETITIESLGKEIVTLNNASAAFQDTGVNSNFADVVSSGTLTRVALSGTAEIGKLAGVAAVTGLTDRSAAGSDFGTTALGAVGNGTGSNLLSVDGRVTEIDASTAAAAVNVRFVGKSDFSATDVTFKGGAGNDYAEFELGNVNATGGAGNDTFAFITGAAGVTNATFGAGDSLVGGAGSDTIQLGLNGVGTFNVAQSEFANKTGFETLDLRGNINNVTLTGSFVAGADAGTVMTVRTDKIVQTSATVTANAAGSSFAEDNAVSTIDLSNINAGQALNFVGGSGSDRIVFTDATATGGLNLDGGTNVANAGAAVAGAGDYDTLTLVNGGILDRADLANVKGFEGLVLVKNTTGNNNFRVELTSAFLLNNTAATNAAETSVDDTVFKIASVAGANGTALAAGDVVTIDISDLLNGTRTGLANALAGRGLDVAVGAAQVNYVVDGAAATAAQVTLVTKGDAARADLAGSVANPTPVAPIVFNVIGTAALDALSANAATDNVQALAGDDNITLAAGIAPTGTFDGGAGTDSLTLGGATTNISAATLTSIETLIATGGAGTTTLTAAQFNGFTTITTAAALTDVATLTTAGTFAIGARAANTNGFDVINLASGGNAVSFTGAAGANQTVNGGAGTDTFTSNNANLINRVVTGGSGSDSLTVTDVLSYGAATFGANTDSIEIYNLQGGLTTTLAGSNNAGVVYNVAGASVAGIVNFGTGGQTVNSTTTGTIRYNGSAASVDTYNLGAGDETVGLGSNIAAVDVVNGFKAAGADKFGTGVVATTLNVLTIATADTSTLAASIQNAATAAGATLSAVTQAYIINVAAGSAAGTYAFQNTTAGAGNVTTVDATDFLVKLTGTVGTLVAADFIV